MEVVYTDTAIKHIDYWKKSGQIQIQKKISKLIVAIITNPYSGIGKPEQLKHQWSDYWSRRINKEHRLIYKVEEEKKRIIIYALKGHY